MTCPLSRGALWFRGIVLAAACAAPPQLVAFEITSHAALTREAYMRTQLTPTPAPGQVSVLSILGLELLHDDLGQTYVDIGSSSARYRNSDPKISELSSITIIANAGKLAAFQPALPSLPAWLMLGAIREDDVVFDYGEAENSPQDDPDGTFNRVFNHFFNPQHNIALVPTYFKAPDWAMEAEDGLLFGRGNHFSWTKAREAEWRALTLRLRNGDSDLGFSPTKEVGTREELRRAYWATTFRSLGDVVHLLQDMAQPQHTRSDPHAGLGCATLTFCAAGHTSLFERYVDSRVSGANPIRLREGFISRPDSSEVSQPTSVVPLNYGGYPIPRFQEARRYFSTGVGADNGTGSGLANYSNRGFYTAGTNIGSIQALSFPSPPTDRSQLTPVRLNDGEVRNAAGDPRPGPLTLWKGSVADSYLGMSGLEPMVALSSEGMFDQYLRPAAKSQFTLNHYNYADQARLLIPRAVAYSAGLIDFFFRGRMEFAPPTDGSVYAIVDQTLQGCKDTCGFDKIKMRARNTTYYDALGAGMLVAVVKFRRNNCYTEDLSGMPGSTTFPGYSCRGTEEEIVVSAPEFIPGLDKTNWTPAEFRFPKRIPINATEVQLQLVFRGVLGTEQDAVVVETHDIGEPTFWGFANVSDYIYSGPRKVYEPLPAGSSDDQFNLRIHFGDVDSPVVAVLPKLKATEHAQFALLAEKGQLKMTREFSLEHGTSLSPAWNYAPTSEFYWRTSVRDYASNFPVTRHRGVYRQAYHFLYWPGDTVYDCESHVEFCAQTTLTPLSPANRKVFDIQF